MTVGLLSVDFLSAWWFASRRAPPIVPSCLWQCCRQAAQARLGLGAGDGVERGLVCSLVQQE